MLASAPFLLAASLAALELAPGTRYDPAIPAPEALLGHDFGEEITPPEGLVTYLRALAQAAPDRARLVEYARSWEGRPLHVLVIGAPERIARLDEIRAGLRRLADPRGLDAGTAEQLVRELPVVVWLAHAVHGNEISSSDAALAEAYHLLAARGDAEVERILAASVVLIDPLQNPDGRARFVHQNLLGRAASPDPEPAAAEHDEPWPGGRGNHYLFDLNRDWFAQAHPESQGRVRFFLDWLPQVVVDLHEMGGESSYYFAPPADPANPHISPAQQAWFERFGRANAARFDARGFAYFVREVFDSFYPGYGESWPLFQGAIGMTYEQASPRGLVYRRRDETLLRYREAVAHHFTAALTTALTAAENREALLRDFHAYRAAAVEEGRRGPVREYLIPPGGDPSRSERLARLLVAQGIEVERALEPLPLAERTLPAGSFVVRLAQPAGRLVRNLLDPQTPLDEDFLAEQDRRRKRRLADQIYDVTGWSLPLVFDVEAVASERATTARTERLVADRRPAPPSPPAARVAYLVPWGSGAAAGVVEALQAGLRVRSAERPFRLAGRAFAAGTAVFRVADNPPELGARLGELAARHGFEVVASDSGYVEEGISLGSNEVVALKAPRVLLAWDQPTATLSAGWARYVLERRFGQPASAVRVRSLRRVDLDRYDVLVLPSGDYTRELAAGELERVKAWVRDGGTLVTLAEASRWASREKVGLVAAQPELRDGRPEPQPGEDDKQDEKKDEDEPPARPFDLDAALAPKDEAPETTPGALVRVELDTEHWLAAGLDGELQAVVEGQRVFTPVSYDLGRNVGLYAGTDRLVASGLVWPEAREALARKAFLVAQPLGQGHVVAFAEDPNFRAFAEATELLFMNAVLLGPAH